MSRKTDIKNIINNEIQTKIYKSNTCNIMVFFFIKELYIFVQECAPGRKCNSSWYAPQYKMQSKKDVA